MTPAGSATGGVEFPPVLQSSRIAVSASPESRLRRSPLRGETRRRGALSAASLKRGGGGGGERELYDQLDIGSMTSSASSVSTLSEPACPIPCGPKGLFMWGVEVGITPRADETVARSAPGAHPAARSCFSVSAADTFTSVHSDAALAWLIDNGVIAHEQRGAAGAILRSINGWLEGSV